MEYFGVPPAKVIDVQALVGDTSDNVPGVPGIGVKTASALIQEYGDLDTLLAKAGEIKQPKRRELLTTYADQARLSRKLVTLDTAVESDVPLAALALPGARPGAGAVVCQGDRARHARQARGADTGVPMETVPADPRFISDKAPAWVVAGPDRMVVSVAPDAAVSEHAIPETPDPAPVLQRRRQARVRRRRLDRSGGACR